MRGRLDHSYCDFLDVSLGEPVPLGLMNRLRLISGGRTDQISELLLVQSCQILCRYRHVQGCLESYEKVRISVNTFHDLMVFSCLSPT